VLLSWRITCEQSKFKIDSETSQNGGYMKMQVASCEHNFASCEHAFDRRHLVSLHSPLFLHPLLSLWFQPKDMIYCTSICQDYFDNWVLLLV
jgi:hypothetical protein